jgi:hypothetical protein
MPVTLEKVKKDMSHFPYDLQMYCYHKLNKRDDEAQTYLDAFNDMQDSIGQELSKVEVVDEKEKINNDLGDSDSDSDERLVKIKK